MKTKIPALCALLLATTAAHGVNTPAVLFRAAFVEVPNDMYLSVELPATSGYYDDDGNPISFWNFGSVAPGGAVDTFYSEKGPGAFQARNNGNLNAYVYITSGDESSMGSTPDGRNYSWFSERADMIPCLPDPSFQRGIPEGYCLAVSTDVNARFPAWRNLSYVNAEGYYQLDSGYDDSTSGRWFDASKTSSNFDPTAGSLSCICCQYLGYLRAGEVQPFDLKFYAPWANYEQVGFIVRLEASTFRRWDHEM